MSRKSTLSLQGGSGQVSIEHFLRFSFEAGVHLEALLFRLAARSPQPGFPC
jgi:hypothetical protein